MPTVAHLTGSLSRLAGGPFESVRRLAQESIKLEPGSATVIGNVDGYWGEDQGLWAPVEVKALQVRGPSRFGYKAELTKCLLATAPDIVHVHGLWTHASIAALQWARRTGRPRIVSPRGMLEPWAWAHHRLRKSLLWNLFEHSHCRRATLLHATSQQEADAIAARLPNARVVVVPNGVDIPSERDLLPLRASRPALRRALFLSRIHPKKGLIPLLEAWSAVKPQGWELAIAGIDEGGHLAQVRKHASDLGITPEVAFLGPQVGSARLAAYASADLFVLPTHSENFGMVVAEALAAGLPVITTRGTPWSQLAAIEAGWWIPLTPHDLAKAITDATSRDRRTLDTMGLNGREWVTSNLSWQAVALSFLDIYTRSHADHQTAATTLKL